MEHLNDTKKELKSQLNSEIEFLDTGYDFSRW